MTEQPINADSLNGFLNVNKPAGMTSHDVVAIIRKRLPRKTKVGHTGTLDPDATGVLPVCVGKATRLAEYFHLLPKTYVGQLVLGVATDSQDASGQVLAQAAPEQLASLTLADLQQALPQFMGEIKQIPPMVSALKVNGQKLCDLARQGKTVERQPRAVTIHQLEVLESNFTLPQPTATLWVVCSSGTYIRTLCHDLGQALGVGGYMAWLERQAVGPFALAQALPLEQLKEQLEQGQYGALQPLELAVEHLPEWQLVNLQQLQDALHGRYIPLTAEVMLQPVCRVTYQNTLVGMGQIIMALRQEDEWVVGPEIGQAVGALKVLKMKKVLLPADLADNPQPRTEKAGAEV